MSAARNECHPSEKGISQKRVQPGMSATHPRKESARNECQKRVPLTRESNQQGVDIQRRGASKSHRIPLRFGLRGAPYGPASSVPRHEGATRKKLRTGTRGSGERVRRQQQQLKKVQQIAATRRPRARDPHAEAGGAGHRADNTSPGTRRLGRRREGAPTPRETGSRTPGSPRGTSCADRRPRHGTAGEGSDAVDAEPRASSERAPASE